jgi:hypothetical protein
MKRLHIALALYALLAVGAWWQLNGELRYLVWFLMAVLAVKSWVRTKGFGGT